MVLMCSLVFCRKKISPKMLGIVQIIVHFIYKFTRPIVKGFLRRFTRLCELQRICYGLESGAPRTLAVENSLASSRNKTLQGLLSFAKDNSLRPVLERSVNDVLRIKRINPEIHSQFPKAFGKCIEQIWGYSALGDYIETLRKTAYDNNNAEHERKLLCLWSTLVPEEPLLSRVTKQWQQIGFQGDDPKTDFRGMGMLGLENLIFLSNEHTSIAQRILRRSYHPKHGYAFAIVGINMTHLAYNLVQCGAAKTHIFNATRSPPTIRTFHMMYCYLFVEFDKFWLDSKPKNIMDFSLVRNKFEQMIRENLKDHRACFKLSVTVDDI